MKKKTAKKAQKKTAAPKKKTRIEKLEAIVSELNIRVCALEAVVGNMAPTVDFSGTAGSSPYIATSFPVYFDYASMLSAMKK